MVCWKLVLPACLVLVCSFTVVAKQADTSERNSLKKKIKTTNGDSSHSFHENILPKTKSLKLRIKNTHQVRNGFSKTSDLCKDAKNKTLSRECGELRLYFKERKPLKLRRQRTQETKGDTRTLIIVKGKQEISREYIKRHHGFKPVLKALKQRIETLKERRKKGLSPRTKPAEHTALLHHMTKFPSLYLVRSTSRETEGGKKQKVVGNGDTEVTEVRTSSPDDIRHWDILGTLHKYEVHKKDVPEPRHQVEKLIEPAYEETPLSKLPLYDDRVLKKATSGLKIFVSDSSEKDKHSSHKTSNAPSSSSGLHDVTSGISTSSGLHDVTVSQITSPQKALSGVTPAPSSSPKSHDVTSGEHTSSGLHDFTSDDTTSSGLHDVTSGKQTSSEMHDVASSDTKLSYNSDDPSSASTSSDVTSGTTLSDSDGVSFGTTTTSKIPDVPESDDDPESSISIEELFNDDDTQSSAKIDRLLSDDRTTDALAKEIANLLTDDPASSSENPKASPNDIAIVTDDAPIEQTNSRPVADVTTVSSEEAVSSAQKSSPLTVSAANQQCLAKRGLGSTECSISTICCSVCCPLDSCPLKDIFKKQDIPDDCDCKRQVVCPGLPNPSPVIPFHSPHPPPYTPIGFPNPSPVVPFHSPHSPPYTPFVTFAETPTSLTWPTGTPGIPSVGMVPPTTPNLLPGLVPPSHPAVFVGPSNVQTPTLIRHPALPYQVAQPALSPLNINFHWPPHVIPHNPGFPPLFRPPLYHRPPLYTHPIHSHSPFMHTPIIHHYPFMHPPFMHHHPPFMHHPPFIHHPPFMHPPMIHPHPPIFHPVHFHPPPVHVPVVIHPPPQPIVVHPPPPPPPPKPTPPPPPPPTPPPKPKPRGPPAPSYSGSDATAAQGNSPGAPPGIPPLVVVGTSKKKSKFPARWMKAASKKG